MENASTRYIVVGRSMRKHGSAKIKPECNGVHITLIYGTKWPPFRRRHPSMHFLQRNAYISIKILLKLIPNGPISNTPALVQIMVCRLVSDNGLAPNRRQPIIWTNADPIHWRIYVALGEDVLTLNCDDTVCSTNATSLLYLFCCHFLWINVKHFPYIWLFPWLWASWTLV